MTRSPHWFKRLWLLCLALGCLLTGCVDYEVGIEFGEQHRGAIVQHIELGEQLTTLSQGEVARWLASVEQRARGLQGKTETLGNNRLVVTIPFGSGQELVRKFNEFFNPPTPPGRRSPDPQQMDLLNLNADLSLTQHNWLLFDHNILRLTVDLRALGVLSNQGNIILSPGSLINLGFTLDTPLGFRTIATESTPDFIPGQGWQLKPGQINTLEAHFWVPSYLAIGTVAIVLLCFGGFYAKYRRWPGVVPRREYG